ncbi:Zinc finger FYVE-related protein [Penicillium brevicompactum]|uniref:Zinc finger FYVE-related protein n=1 Tax=Penicillium brevicompactum TaxID=5074 RepID=A0A9W9QU74_PENBR|nr:Zinc finger FYVE-related protein [Penicillium brevicompactum]KAJ5343717.1 Zinc finger FYVE-related protein [Penicillium brevicompactum]KAJ5345766.1 Zinc finger FYVE-related protein [Penicillium brevicompactum]KAJ5350692.1 Zinc finger FYVE-related protein [Penicillium brevicompactum]
MATHVMTSTPSQISVYGQPSPTNSANNSATNTPSNNSPTSPRMATASLHQLPLQSRQLRPLKGPLYVPAALRPTERPQKSSPITPPRSVHGSLDSLNEDVEPISRRSTMESQSSGISQVAQHELMKIEDLGEVTGQPTREHWKADSASSNCDSPTCRSSFGIFLRRHHCRHCGHVFCASHTPHLVPLDQNARFHPEGVPSRACDLCWSAHQRWEETRSDRLNKIQNNMDAQVGVSVPDSEHIENQESKAQSTEVAASVPRDWNWSTF